MSKLGVIYVAFGAPYLAMSLVSAATLRATNPDVPIMIVTNVAREPPHVYWWREHTGDVWQYVEGETDANRLTKTDIFRLSPFENTLYLDCDTAVLADISQINFFLDYFDLLMMYQSNPGTDRKRTLFDGALPYSTIGHFNGGVVAFRKNKEAEKFFRLWNERYRSMNIKRDQPSLVEALYISDARLLPLQPAWNAGQSIKEHARRRKDIVVWHYKTRTEARLEALIRGAGTWWNSTLGDRIAIEAFVCRRRRWRTRTKSGIISSLRDLLRGQ